MMLMEPPSSAHIYLILCKAITTTTWSAKGMHLQLCEVRRCDPTVLEDHLGSSHGGDKSYTLRDILFSWFHENLRTRQTAMPVAAWRVVLQAKLIMV
uniref:Uncharacterized protein n=1 Tax=Tanacetum cinerariifolium TaxID=118510 RepID=A0A6L2MYP6_TANCI|nr:hypothetical protein [Tanacetum cinerariifolium]